MGAALKVRDSVATENAPDVGKRASAGYIQSVAAQLRHILSDEPAFRPWEIEAIVNSVIKVFSEMGQLDEGRLAAELHSKGLQEEFSDALAKVLSHNR